MSGIDRDGCNYRGILVYLIKTMDNRLKEFNAIYRECIIDRLNLLLERLKEDRENEETLLFFQDDKSYEKG